MRFAVGPMMFSSLIMSSAMMGIVSPDTLCSSHRGGFATANTASSATTAPQTAIRCGTPQRFGGSICTLRLLTNWFNAMVSPAVGSKRVIGVNQAVPFFGAMLFGFGSVRIRSAECMLRFCTPHLRGFVIFLRLRFAFHHHLLLPIPHLVHSTNTEQDATTRNEQ